MNIILLSGGSGKRLWPLSNDNLRQQGVHFLVGAYLFVGHGSSTPKFVVQGSGPMYTTIRAFAPKYNIPSVKAV